MAGRDSRGMNGGVHTRGHGYPARPFFIMKDARKDMYDTLRRCSQRGGVPPGLLSLF